MTGRQIADLLSQISRRKIMVRRMSWIPLRLVAPFWPMAKSLLEMRYLWDTSHNLQCKRMSQLCPSYRDTDVEDALRQAAAPWLSRVRHARCAQFCHFTKRSTQTNL